MDKYRIIIMQTSPTLSSSLIRLVDLKIVSANVSRQAPCFMAIILRIHNIQCARLQTAHAYLIIMVTHTYIHASRLQVMEFLKKCSHDLSKTTMLVG